MHVSTSSGTPGEALVIYTGQEWSEKEKVGAGPWKDWNWRQRTKKPDSSCSDGLYVVVCLEENLAHRLEKSSGIGETYAAPAGGGSYSESALWDG